MGENRTEGSHANHHVALHQTCQTTCLDIRRAHETCLAVYLARIACVTKTYFIRLFKQEFSLSPIQYINKKRVERAQLLLFTTDLSVKEVAYHLGISDHSYFSRLFRKVAGITPKEYRYQQRT